MQATLYKMSKISTKPFIERTAEYLIVTSFVGGGILLRMREGFPDWLPFALVFILMAGTIILIIVRTGRWLDQRDPPGRRKSEKK